VGSDVNVDPNADNPDWTYDPNEPRYCICNQVSYGDMVACDNEDVSIGLQIGTPAGAITREMRLSKIIRYISSAWLGTFGTSLKILLQGKLFK
jgi:hypothetical protein